MTDLMPEKIVLTSARPSDEKLAALRDLIPEAFTEGKIDFDALRRSLGDAVETAPREERFGLRWPGKSRLQAVINQPSVGTLVPQPEESVDWDTTQNVIIEGDNLEVLKLLQKSYAGKVKMIYIDPPYNTGNDFVYPDNHVEGLQSYLEFTGQMDAQGRKLQANTESEGRYHANWLNMMYPRLYLARNLLRKDGMIFISVDDNEVDNLTKAGKEVFGDENHIGTITRATGTPTGGGFSGLTNMVDYVVVFRRGQDATVLGLEFGEADASIYNEQDEKGRYLTRSLRRTGGEDRREDRPSMYYALAAPDGSSVYPIGPGGYESRWICGRDRFVDLVDEGLVEWKQITRDGKGEWHPYQKFYLDGREKRPSNLWTDLDGNKKGTREIRQIFNGEKAFESPKPVGLIQRVIQISTNQDSLVLDFFSGSGTTGHAVTKQNAEDGGKRRFILVQLPEPLAEPKTLDDGTTLDTVADICRERVRRAGRKIAAEYAGKDMDIGFRAYRLAPSNFRPWDGRVGKSGHGEFMTSARQMSFMPQTIQQQLELAADHLHPDANDASLLAELLLRLGFELTTPVRRESLAGKTVYTVDDGLVLVCLDRAISLDVIEAMAKRTPAEIICLDAGFPNDQTKVNSGQIIASHARDGETSIAFKVV